jgi:hypothetical protein
VSAIRLIEPVVRICAVITRHDAALDWAVDCLASRWGTIHEVSEAVPFDGGRFYRETMGDGLTQTLVAAGSFIDPVGLADWKIETNDWEAEYAALNLHAEPRPLNLDAGYLSQAKLVLATIKDRDHRIYLRRGIFAEVTLNYVAKAWHHHRWSYPSYRDPVVAQFCGQVRIRLRKHLIETGQIRRAV